MNLVLEPRHWVIMTFAALFGVTGYLALPVVVPIYPMTALAFPLIAIAAILELLPKPWTDFRLI